VPLEQFQLVLSRDKMSVTKNEGADQIAEQLTKMVNKKLGDATIHFFSDTIYPARYRRPYRTDLIVRTVSFTPAR
jgi:hypothetical protein